MMRLKFGQTEKFKSIFKFDAVRYYCSIIETEVAKQLNYA